MIVDPELTNHPKFRRLERRVRPELRDFLDREFFSMVSVLGWNQRRNGGSGGKFVSRYDGPGDPDDDFIDLDAMLGNVVAGIWKECDP